MLTGSLGQVGTSHVLQALFSFQVFSGTMLVLPLKKNLYMLLSVFRTSGLQMIVMQVEIDFVKIKSKAKLLISDKYMEAKVRKR